MAGAVETALRRSEPLGYRRLTSTPPPDSARMQTESASERRVAPSVALHPVAERCGISHAVAFALVLDASQLVRDARGLNAVCSAQRSFVARLSRAADVRLRSSAGSKGRWA